MEGLRGESPGDIGKALLDLAMPRVCVVCGRNLLLRERFICIACQSDLPFTHYWERTHNPMADKFNDTIQHSPDAAGEHYSYAAALFFYNSESLYKNIPRHIKYGGGIACGRYFAGILGRHLAATAAFGDVDVIIPVPLHRLRRWRRGYNQAQILAEALAGAFPTPPQIRTDIIYRKRRTRTQTRLSLEAKSSNVSHAFALCRKAGSVPRPRHILLVDDTFTTGATLNACRGTLRRIFPVDSTRISAATLSYVSSK